MENEAHKNIDFSCSFGSWGTDQERVWFPTETEAGVVIYEFHNLKAIEI